MIFFIFRKVTYVFHHFGFRLKIIFQFRFKECIVLHDLDDR